MVGMQMIGRTRWSSTCKKISWRLSFFDCGVPLVRVPARGVSDHLRCTIPEIDAFVKGRGAIGDFLAERFREYLGEKDPVGYSKVIWDMAPVAWVLNHAWVPTILEASPVLTNDYTWSFDAHRHLSRTATADIKRDDIFRDFFHKLDDYANQTKGGQKRKSPL